MGGIMLSFVPTNESRAKSMTAFISKKMGFGTQGMLLVFWEPNFNFAMNTLVVQTSPDRTLAYWPGGMILKWRFCYLTDYIPTLAILD
jgi:hypothetical protein